MLVTLFGFYGCGNMGDEQLLDDTVRLVKAYSGRFIVANGRYSTPFPSFNRWNFFSWCFYLFRSKHLILGGGSLFQSSTSLLSLLYYLFIVVLAYVFRCNVILLCHGWGPFKRPWHESLTKFILKGAHRSWRSSNSYSNEFNDDVFCDLTLIQPLPKETPQNSSNLAISIRSMDDATQLAMALEDQFSDIQYIKNDINSKDGGVLLDDIWDENKLNASILITDRFHSAIWAIRHGIYWVAISNDPKVTDLANLVNQPVYENVAMFIASNYFSQDHAPVNYQAVLNSCQQLRPQIKDWLDVAMSA